MFLSVLEWSKQKSKHMSRQVSIMYPHITARSNIYTHLCTHANTRVRTHMPTHMSTHASVHMVRTHVPSQHIRPTARTYPRTHPCACLHACLRACPCTCRHTRYVPNVIEPSFGIDRILYAILEHAYYERPTEEPPADDKACHCHLQ